MPQLSAVARAPGAAALRLQEAAMRLGRIVRHGSIWHKPVSNSSWPARVRHAPVLWRSSRGRRSEQRRGPHGRAVMHFVDSQSRAARTWVNPLAAEMRCSRVVAVAAWSRLGGGSCVALVQRGRKPVRVPSFNGERRCRKSAQAVSVLFWDFFRTRRPVRCSVGRALVDFTRSSVNVRVDSRTACGPGVRRVAWEVEYEGVP